MAISKPVMHKHMVDCISNFGMFLVKPGDGNTELEINISVSAYSQFYSHNRPTVCYTTKREKRTSYIPAFLVLWRFLLVRGVLSSLGDESEAKSKTITMRLVPMKRSTSSELTDQSGNEEKAHKSSRIRIRHYLLSAKSSPSITTTSPSPSSIHN